MSVKISAVLITKNGGPYFQQCLDSLAFADEIVVLDSGSTDDTVAIAEMAGARVFVSEDWPGFGPQRQRAQEHARGEWLFWVDTDEVVTDDLAASIQDVVARGPENTVFQVKRLSWFFGRFIRHSGWYPDKVVRLYRRGEFGYDDALVHEKVHCPGAMMDTLDGDLLHYTATDFADYMAKSLRYANDWADARAVRGKTASLFSACSHSLAAFFRKYVLQKGFLDGRHGFLLAVTTAIYAFNKYAALWLKTYR
ncbi:(heptosyl)LPS beta-1,4-glucosyltransferase [Marinobacter persicus]|uniref:(Heptosyl)LPS beta-1,4-glucosyltransferase n=1 Tax=Marinobacter persicus TaxID=930118 RepID=A0A1I3X9A6_9GAMM|nr:glycosyltransferase family 2 protein [Marinobacter persicus]GHD48845.1 LPS biosynthesis protein [Marinobacter persicus]SFK15869.1 (heptosyl)LPS beta-1,4-glucosyltransferase [Marinobacter persicus]